MRSMRLLAVVALVSLVGCTGDGTADAQTIEVGCAKCSYALDGHDECAAACKVDGKVVLLEGVSSEFDKLMAEHGFCAPGGKPVEAKAVGKMEGDKFVASSLTGPAKTE